MDHSTQDFQVICIAPRQIHRTDPRCREKYDEIWICQKILERKFKEQCSAPGCIQDQESLGYVKTQVAWTHTLNLTPCLIMLSHLWTVHPHFSLPSYFKIFPLSTHALPLPWLSHLQLHSRLLCALPVFFWMKSLGKRKSKLCYNLGIHFRKLCIHLYILNQGKE